MRKLLTCAAILTCLSAARAEDPNVTVLLEFEQPHSSTSLLEMERETQTILKDSGLKLQFRMKQETPTDTVFQDVVVVRMKGQCKMDNFPVLLDERGPLAYTHTTDGEVLPFSEVQCDRIRRSINSAMVGGDRGRADQLFGRAMGRVLAHEMFHIFAQTGQHGKQGVAKTALSGSQLISDSLPMDPHEVRTLQESRRRATGSSAEAEIRQR